MKRLLKNRKAYVGASLLAILMALGAAQLYLQEAVAQGKQAPRFEVDPFWPKPMPDNWVLGQTIGVSVDERDHVWIVHRGNDPALSTIPSWRSRLSGTGCASANAATRPRRYSNSTPPGNFVSAWGGPSRTGEYEWPTSNHSIVVDHKGFVWIGGNGPRRRAFLKFTRDGKFVAQYGKADARKDPASPANKPAFKADSTDMNSFGRVAKIMIDAKTNEGYVADGYLNHRVAVIDLDTGKIKRLWGAYGKPPTDEILAPYDPAAPVASSSATRFTAR